MSLAESIRGDFVVAAGPQAQAWLARLPGFEVHPGGPSIWFAARGEVLRGTTSQGLPWAALADLVEGDITAVNVDDERYPQRSWRGRFAHAAWSPDSGRIQLFTDHFGSLPLYWYQRDGHYAIASDLRLLLDAPGVRREPDLRAVYHYLNFTCIPAPLTICSDIQRVEPGTRLTVDGSHHSSSRYYLPEYPEDLQGSDEQLADQLRQRIVASVQAFRPQGDDGWGCFLSGGTDSSSIVSILANQKLSQVHSCSIGFREAGYDELDFARLAGEACGAHTHLAQVDQTRALGLLDTVVEAYDQPFGNASAVPTLACAELGQAQGFSLMLGGDGGDEVFGGNQRYAKDRVMQGFHDLPSPVKKAASAIGEWVGGGNNHLLNRVRNFTRRGSLPNPDRFYTDDSFASDFYGELLTLQLRQRVPQEASLEAMRQIYNQGGPAAPLHRIMRLDLLMAIAQNDLVKVHRACKQHGVSARFPLLDPQLVDFCGQLAARHKVRGLKKRYLFKQAMASILPAEILSKRKQGFGLPIAIWMKEDPALQARVRDILLDDRTRQRGWINPDFVRQLVRMHMDGGWDHSNAIWQLLILELWMRRYMDAK